VVTRNGSGFEGLTCDNLRLFDIRVLRAFLRSAQLSLLYLSTGRPMGRVLEEMER
jgi:pullulanase/glycogen debranching enzyme